MEIKDFIEAEDLRYAGSILLGTNGSFVPVEVGAAGSGVLRPVRFKGQGKMTIELSSSDLNADIDFTIYTGVDISNNATNMSPAKSAGTAITGTLGSVQGSESISLEGNPNDYIFLSFTRVAQTGTVTYRINVN